MSEQIATLEKQITVLRDALVGLASGHMIALDGAGNPVVVYGAVTNVTHHNSYGTMECNLSPYQHHYRMPSGLCCCQDHSWAR